MTRFLSRRACGTSFIGAHHMTTTTQLDLSWTVLIAVALAMIAGAAGVA